MANAYAARPSFIASREASSRRRRLNDRFWSCSTIRAAEPAARYAPLCQSTATPETSSVKAAPLRAVQRCSAFWRRKKTLDKPSKPFWRMEGWWTESKVSPSEETLQQIWRHGAGGATSDCRYRGNFWPGSPGRPPWVKAQDPRSSCDGARSPSAISATKAGRGFSRPHPACAPADGQSEASLLGAARSFDPGEATSSGCHKQPDLSLACQSLSLPSAGPPRKPWVGTFAHSPPGFGK